MIVVKHSSNCIFAHRLSDFLKLGGCTALKTVRSEILPDVGIGRLFHLSGIKAETAQHAGGADATLSFPSVYRSLTALLPARPCLNRKRAFSIGSELA